MKYLRLVVFSGFGAKYFAFLKVNEFITERKFGSKSLSEFIASHRNFHKGGKKFLLKFIFKK